MPTVSKKQEKFMQAVANNPEFAEKVGVNQSIGREFIKGKDMKKNYMYGGKVKKMNMGGRTGDMMYSRGYGTDERSKRMPTMLMDRGPSGMKRGGRVGKKEQGFKDRKDESIAMRVKKKRTKKQLKASANESYGKFGSKARKKGKINK